jgi:hypothetical protein
MVTQVRGADTTTKPEPVVATEVLIQARPRLTGRTESSAVEARATESAPLRRFVKLNLAVAALMLLDGVLEAIIYGDIGLLATSAFFVAPFVWFAWHLDKAEPAGADRWLRISGVACLGLAAMCIWSGVSAFTSTPQDVTCVVMSMTFLGILGASGVYQLREAGGDEA